MTIRARLATFVAKAGIQLAVLGHHLTRTGLAHMQAHYSHAPVPRRRTDWQPTLTDREFAEIADRTGAGVYVAGDHGVADVRRPRAALFHIGSG